MEPKIRLDMRTMLDPQRLRKWLYQELLYWNDADYFPPERASRWHRMAKRCARMLGTSRDAFVAELGAQVRAHMRERADPRGEA